MRESEAARPALEIVAIRPVAGAVAGFLADIESAGDLARIDAVADVLSAGLPGASLELIREVAEETAPNPAAAGGKALVYWAAVCRRLQRPDFGTAFAEMEDLLAEAGSAGEDWSASDEAELSLRLLSAALAPLAGLDVPAGLEYAKVYVASFPPFSLPLGDVDERAARWLAQLLDTGATRTGLRNLLSELADLWAGRHPLAAGQVRAWAEEPLPEDPTRDGPWMRAMLWLARSQV